MIVLLKQKGVASNAGFRLKALTGEYNATISIGKYGYKATKNWPLPDYLSFSLGENGTHLGKKGFRLPVMA